MDRVLVAVTPRGDDWSVVVTHCLANGSKVPIGTGHTMTSVGPVLELGGGSTARVKVPAGLPEDQLKGLLERQVKQATVDDDGRVHGMWLHTALLGPVWQEIEAIGVKAGGVEVALKFAVDEMNLQCLLWEAMWAGPRLDASPGTGPEPVAGFSHPRPLVAITRLVAPAIPQTWDLPYKGIPRVLFVTGAKFTDPDIRPGAMFLGLLRSFEARGLCVSRVALEVTLDQLKTHCKEFAPDVVHLVAHGRFDRDAGDVKLTFSGEPAGYQSVLEAIGRPLAVFLSACESGRSGPNQAPFAARLVEAGIPIVAAMAGRVGVSACRLFTRQVVEAVAKGTSLVEASAHGRRAALVRPGAACSDLDWALPTVFLAEGLTPDTHVLDTAAVSTAASVVKSLLLGRTPIFAGRTEILKKVDSLFSEPVPQDRIGLLAVTSPGSLVGLGSKRLLLEIACRLVRAGHLPILVGPGTGGAARPTTFAAVMGRIAEGVVVVRRQLLLPPRWPAVLGVPPVAWDDATIDIQIAALAAGDAPHPLVMKPRIAADISALVEEIRTWGAPFGPHTGAALLADKVHEWGAGLEGLVTMVNAGGIGGWHPNAAPGEARIPLVFSASFKEGAGIWLKEREPELVAGWARFLPLAPFSEDEAIMAYNWTLLHPSTTRGAYIAKSDKDAERWDKILRKGMPPHMPIKLDLPLNEFTRNYLFDDEGPLREIQEDDDAAMKEYERHR